MNEKIEKIKRVEEINWMLDLETDGLDPAKNSITSIALTQFEVGEPWDEKNITYHKSLTTMFNGRSANRDTLVWRDKHHVTSKELELDYIEIHDMCIDICNLFNNKKKNILWAKPITFDIAFLISYFNQYCAREIPWHYRDVRDLRSYIEGFMFHVVPEYYVQNFEERNQRTRIYMNEKYGSGNWAHNALRDCEFQIQLLVY